MNAAIRPVSAIPSMPLGRYSSISSGIALLYSMLGWPPPRPGITASATRPGMIVTNGMKIFGIGADQRRAPRGAERSCADSARWTSAKFVVQ